MRQQGQDVFNGTEATFDTDASRKAISVLIDLMDGGYITRDHDYASVEKAFINGDTTILINGTRVVDAYNAQANDPATALQNYSVSSLPTLFGDEGATWADQHMWVIPASLKAENPERCKAALALLSFINENDLPGLSSMATIRSA